MSIIKTKEKGNLIVISGPSGAGKDTIVNEILKKNKNCWLSVSMTSREPRAGEINKINYYFVNEEEFEENIRNDNFIEYAKYNNNYYGTPKSAIIEKLNEGFDVILVIEIQGALQLKEKMKEAIFIFIMPPSMDELKNRLILRNAESMDKILNRFKIAYKEINEVTKYNYVVVNDNLDDAVNKVNSILISEKCRVDRIEELYLNSDEEKIHELLVEKDLMNENINI